MNFENFHKISEVKKSIERLNQTVFPRYNDKIIIEEFVNKVTGIIENEFSFIPNIIYPFKNKDILSRFFRARECDKISNIDLISEHSYPPISKAKLGRCNFPELPVFYCSDDAMTALIECAKNYGNRNKRYCISKWEIIPTEDLLIFESFLQSNLPVENNYYDIVENMKTRIIDLFEESLKISFDKERKEGVHEYLKYLDSLFISDKNYAISASLAYRNLYAKHNLRTDILMYPSVQTLNKGVNFAIHPNFVDNNLKLTRLYIVGLDDYNSTLGKIQITFYKYAEIEKNVFMWKNIDLDNVLHKEIVKQDFGKMINSKSQRDE
jgi:hypothetical protein